MLKNPFVTTSMVMLKKKDDLRFNSSFRRSEDYLLWCEILLSQQKGCFLDAPLGYVHKHHYGESGLSADLWEMELGELQVFQTLYRNGRINWPMHMVATGFSILKYVKRVMHTKIRRWS